MTTAIRTAPSTTATAATSPFVDSSLRNPHEMTTDGPVVQIVKISPDLTTTQEMAGHAHTLMRSARRQPGLIRAEALMSADQAHLALVLIWTDADRMSAGAVALRQAARALPSLDLVEHGALLFPLDLTDGNAPSSGDLVAPAPTSTAARGS